MQSQNAYFWKMLFLTLHYLGRRGLYLYFVFAVSVVICTVFRFLIDSNAPTSLYCQPRFGPTLCLSVGLYSGREGGREMSAPGQCEKQSFRPLSSVVILYWNHSLYVHKIVLVISFILSLNCLRTRGVHTSIPRVTQDADIPRYW